MKKIFVFIIILCLFLSMTVYANPVYKREGFRLNRGAQGIALMYHFISEDSSLWNDFCVSPKTFEEDILALIKKDYIFIKPRDIHKIIYTYDKKYAILTFDDGYESDYKYVYPLLLKYKIPAIFFITGAYIDKPGYLTSEQIAEMSKSQYVEFGNHSYEIHENSAVELKLMFGNNSKSKSIIEDFLKTENKIIKLTGRKSAALSYPYGIYTSNIEKLIKKEFDDIITFSTNYGKLTLPYKGIPLNRINRANSADISQFIN